MKSMTGYGISEIQNKKIRMVCEIKSYNNKFLDMSINIPSFLSPLDPEIRRWIQDRVARGRVELTVRVKELEEDLEVIVDPSAVKTYSNALSEIAAAAGIHEEPHISHFLKLEGVLTTLQKRNIDEYRDTLFTEMEKAFVEYEKVKEIEGFQTERDIENNLSALEEMLILVKSKEKEMEQTFKNNIVTRFHELLNEELDENRVLSETALLLMKYGIGEEINRLEGHFKQFRIFLKENNPVGKKLDFLCQEINREINTIGSKTTLLEISSSVVGAKDSLEKIREQLRNVE